MKRLARTTATTAFAALTGLAALMPGLASAQNGYPTKPIRVIVPFAAGSTTDIIARAIADKMSQSMGQTLVIDNRGGASGTIGQQAVATAAPDGYTVMIHSSSHTVSPSTFAKLPFDTVGDFAGVTPISSHAQRAGHLAHEEHQDAAATAGRRARQARQHELRLGRPGQRHAPERRKIQDGRKDRCDQHPLQGIGRSRDRGALGPRRLLLLAHRACHRPDQGTANSLALAVGSPKRASALPHVPTTAEAGVPGSEFNFWIGMMAPGKTPRDVVNRLHDEVVKA
jgi:tripartite-type tricarboxylate transporter receptor subunit TctC